MDVQDNRRGTNEIASYKSGDIVEIGFMGNDKFQLTEPLMIVTPDRTNGRKIVLVSTIDGVHRSFIAEVEDPKHISQELLLEMTEGIQIRSLNCKLTITD